MNTILSSSTPRPSVRGPTRLLQWGACLLLGCQGEVPESEPTPEHVRVAQEFVGTWRYETGSLSWSCDSGAEGEDWPEYGDRELAWFAATQVEARGVCGHYSCVDCTIRFHQSADSPDVVEVETEACEEQYSSGSTYVISLTQWEFELSESGNMLTEYSIFEGVSTSPVDTTICQYWLKGMLFRVPE